MKKFAIWTGAFLLPVAVGVGLLFLFGYALTALSTMSQDRQDGRDRECSKSECPEGTGPKIVGQEGCLCVAVPRGKR